MRRVRRKRTPSGIPIERRIIDAMIWLVHARKWTPKVIYLTETDMARLPEPYRKRRYIDGIPVRIGRQSILYADHYRGVTI